MSRDSGVSEAPQRCPCCKQLIKNNGAPRAAARVCYDCGRPIGGNHKWQMAERKGISTPVHRVCCNPSGYMRAAACKKAGVVYYKDMTDEQIAAQTAREDELEAQFAAWREENGR